MLRLYNINPEELFFKWESYCMRLGFDGDVKVNADIARDFKKDTGQALEAEVKAKGGVKRAPAGPTGRTLKAGAGAAAAAGVEVALGLYNTPRKNAGVKRKYDRSPYETPSSKSAKTQHLKVAPSSPLHVGVPLKELSLTESSQITPFSKRPQPGTIRETLNPQIPRPTLPLSPPTTWGSRVTLNAIHDLKEFKYRTMHQKLYEASEMLDQKIEAVVSQIQERYGVTSDELTDPSATKPAEIIAVGRIVSDSIVDGTLNTASMLLESCRRIGAGSRVPLKLDKLEKVEGRVGPASFFPGQIVALRGVNPNGEFFSVKEILEIPRSPWPATPREDLITYGERLEAGGLSIMMAAGPYTTHDNLDYEPLEELCRRAAETRPDVLMLMGPFIDIDHPLVAMGDFELEGEGPDGEGGTLEDLFRERISRKIDMVDSVGTMVILIPNTRDAVVKHSAFPQEAMKRKVLELPENVRCLPNPSIFSLNEVVFGATTVDHILTQRSFYPIFPPPPAPANGVAGPPLDLPHLPLANFAKVRPDVLILPSQQEVFARTVEGVVVVNPGMASEKRASGTFAEMVIGKREIGGGEHGDGEEEAEGTGGVMLHKVWERVRVDVLRV
ncbi:DNA polymerase alpha subunit B N-terminal-domain-containing protein [Kalaharituber pfeilii]|nr:DNA polymerase alpha subunit B N-terminal-domain-containing protein [Kalaharituber pfeilii]